MNWIGAGKKFTGPRLGGIGWDQAIDDVGRMLIVWGL